MESQLRRVVASESWSRVNQMPEPYVVFTSYGCDGGGIMKFGLAISLLFAAGAVGAQVSVDVSSYGVKVLTGKGGASNSVSVQSGVVESDVQIDGVAVINDDVFVDGEKVPREKASYTSKKTGKTYLIRRSKGGNVSVSEK